MVREITFVVFKLLCDIGWFFRHRFWFGWRLYYWALNKIVNKTGYNYYHQPFGKNEPIKPEEILQINTLKDQLNHGIDFVRSANKYKDHIDSHGDMLNLNLHSKINEEFRESRIESANLDYVSVGIDGIGLGLSNITYENNPIIESNNVDTSSNETSSYDFGGGDSGGSGSGSDF